MLVWLAQTSKIWRLAINHVKIWGLQRWHLLLIMMFCFALNRYAVASIHSQKRELEQRKDLLERESLYMQNQINLMRDQVRHFNDPCWQEMVLMRHLLLFPRHSEVYWSSWAEIENSAEL